MTAGLEMLSLRIAGAVTPGLVRLSVGLANLQDIRRDLEIGFTTESGFTFPDVQVAYQTRGPLNPDHSNAIFIAHALTGDSHVCGEAGSGPRQAPGGSRCRAQRPTNEPAALVPTPTSPSPRP